MTGSTKAQPATPPGVGGLPPLQPGDWTPTGWGAQHRVRKSDDQWTELVCHTTVRHPDKISPGPTHRCETSRINRDADEHHRCHRCAALDDLGPIVHAPRGEVRRSPDGEVAVCVRDRDGWRNGSDWKLITEEKIAGLHGWRSDWDVARWERTGNVLDRPVGQGTLL